MTVTRTPAKFGTNVKDFGAKGNGTTNDTTAIQAWVTYITTNHLAGFMPAGTYKITSRIEFPRTYGWSVIGEGKTQTTIVQDTDNTAIFWLGSDDASQLHSWTIQGVGFTYTNSQSSSNTNANPIAFNKPSYLGVLRDLTFTRGAYAICVVAAVDAPWGCIWDDLFFESGLTIGAIDNATLGLFGTPNNHWGKFYVRADNMVGPIFYVRGDNFVVDCIEINAANQGPKLFRLAAGSEVRIGAFKLENGSYTTAGTQFLIEGLANTMIMIDQMQVSGTTMTIGATTNVYAIQSDNTGAVRGGVTAGLVRLGGTGISGKLYAFNGTPIVGHLCRTFISQDTNARLTNNGAATTADSLFVDGLTNHRMSANKGDANYTVTLRDPNIIQLETAFTAQRTITLPSDGDNMHNGLYYEIVVNAGVVNGANTLLIKASSTTLHTETTDKKVIRFTWRRNATPASGWKMTSYQTLP